MKKLVLWLLAFAMMNAPNALIATILLAQTAAPAATVSHAPGDIAGNWQGTLHAGKDLRIIFNFYKGEKDAWSAKMYSIDQGGQPVEATSVTRQGSLIKVSVDMIGGTFNGKLSADSNSIEGTWTQGKPLPLLLVRATPETAWEIPAPPPPPKLLPAHADPSFEVATIKPNPSGATSLRRITTNGHDFTVRNGSLADLISFTYDVQLKQIVGGPGWMDEDRYDIDARQDQNGMASDKQLRGMVRKLLADRFKLTVHHEQREMSAFVLAVGKNGQKLTPTQIKSPLPGMGFGPVPGGLILRINNGTMDNLTDFLQSTVLDRPVVNHTNIPGRFDIAVTFMPDESQFKGHPPKIPPSDVSEAPNLFTAIQQQLGLKLEAKKTMADVVVIDHVEKPSPN